MSIKGYNYVVSLIAYLKQNLQGFNARSEKVGGRRGNGDVDGASKHQSSSGETPAQGTGCSMLRGGGGTGPHWALWQGFVQMQIAGPFLLQQAKFGEFDLINHQAPHKQTKKVSFFQLETLMLLLVWHS